MNINFKSTDTSYFMIVDEQAYRISDNYKVYLGIITTKFFDDIINELWNMSFILKDQMFTTYSPFGSRIFFTEKDLDKLKLLAKIYS